MAIIDTTNVTNSSMLLKSRLNKNMSKDNHYINDLQAKRDQDWEFRYNVVGIEEEREKQIGYTDLLPNYTPLDVVIRSVKGENGKDLRTDWAQLSFRDLKYDHELGKRFRFNLEFPDMSLMSEEDKYYDTSVWININASPINPGCSCVVRRCNASIAVLGSPTGKIDDITEVRYEPVVVDSELKYMQLYYNQTLVVPQSELYLTVQMNYFSNCIKINDRIILGSIDVNEELNNSLYKVKAVIKCASTKTFVRQRENGIKDIPLIVLALDKDTVADEDNFEKRIPKNAPVYLIPEKENNESNEYQIVLDPQDTKIILGDSRECKTYLSLKGNRIDTEFEYQIVLNGIKEENWKNYYIFTKLSENSFVIKNLKTCNRGTLDVTASCKDPNDSNITFSEVFRFKLGGFY